VTARARISKLAHPAVLLLLVAILAYGLLLPQMGFYWDELPMSWIRYELGPEAMTRYFSTNRPVWGMLYQITTRFLPQVAIYWEVFGLFWRWLAAVLVWGIARSLWPGHNRFAIASALAFLIYPGFNQQWTSYLYSHFLIVLCFLLLSFLCTIWSLQHRRWYWPLTVAALLLSALNLWMMEYFFVLELWRPFMILGITWGVGTSLGLWPSIRRVLLLSAPYLVVFVANVLWRLFVFNNQVYQPTLIPALRSEPIGTAWELIKTIVLQVYTVTLAAWSQIFTFTAAGVQGPRTTALYVAVVLATALLIWLASWARPPSASRDTGRIWQMMGLGAVAMIAAGGPFWLTGLEVTTAYPANRFTLPFMLGAAIFLAAVLELLLPTWWRIALVGLIGLAAGRQALWADSYRRDWETQKALFWQMIWRAPGIEPHTIVLLNEGALPYYADNSLTGPLNWIYDPDNRSTEMDYVLFYPTSRLGGTLQSLEPGQPITYDFISEVFTGNTSQSLAFYYQPPACLRLLDPLMDPGNHFVADASLMREAARLSSSAWITPQSSARMPSIYGPEPPHGWCYYFERAQLAAQTNDWEGVVSLGREAFALNDYPNSPVERFVFIEGFAHSGLWSDALEQSTASYKVSRQYVGPLLCALWDRIGSHTPESTRKTNAITQARTLFACSPQ
jgi:hypothetical protein